MLVRRTSVKLNTLQHIKVSKYNDAIGLQGRYRKCARTGNTALSFRIRGTTGDQLHGTTVHVWVADSAWKILYLLARHLLVILLVEAACHPVFRGRAALHVSPQEFKPKLMGE